MKIDTEQLREKLLIEKEKQRDVMNMRKFSVLTDLYYLERIEELFLEYFGDAK